MVNAALVLVVVSTLATPPSQSAGSVNRGQLQQGVPLSLDGEHHRFTSTVRRKGSNYGTQEMIALLRRSMKTVGVEGAPTILGSISRCDGGHMRPHKSHQSGRDVDILFYVKDRKGTRKASRGFVRFDGNGRCVQSSRQCAGMRFDVQRNWWLVRTLVWSKDPQVQFIFVADPLKELMLKYAKKRGEHTDILRRARTVLRQPGDSSPHADHFHVRIYCSPGDRSHGCVDKGPRWSWIQ